jgi:hypothetical protein
MLIMLGAGAGKGVKAYYYDLQDLDKQVFCAKSHHCGISSFPPKFPVVGGFDG